MLTTTLVDNFVRVCYSGSSKAYETVEYVYFGVCENIESELNDTDSYNKINLARSFMRENKVDIDSSPSCKLLSTMICNNISDVETTLHKINKKMENWKNCFFKNWRSCDCEADLKLLKQQTGKLMRNFELLCLMRISASCQDSATIK